MKKEELCARCADPLDINKAHSCILGSTIGVLSMKPYDKAGDIWNSPQEDWEREFDTELCEKANGYLYWRNWTTGNKNLVPTPNEVKSFIRSLLTAEREQIVNEVEETIQKFHNRHQRCIGTDAEYSDREMCEMLSNVMKQNYLEDSADFQKLLSALKK